MIITYHKGPLGYAVAKNGRPIGVIKDAGGRWLGSINGFRPGVDPATRGKHSVLTLREAKALVELHA